MAMDHDGSGAVEYTEFLAATIHERDLLSRARLEAVFYRMDVSKKGALDRDDIARILGTKNEDKVTEFLALFDLDEAGKISTASAHSV